MKENGDATLNRAWRQASDEQPPAHLDAAIMASARKAVQDRDDAAKVIRTSRRSRNRLTGWQPLAAAAGVVGLAFVLVQSLPREGDVAPAIRMEEPLPGPTTAPESVRGPPAPEAKEESAGAATARASAEVPAAATDSKHTKRTAPPPPPPPVSVPRATSAAGAADEDASANDPAAMRAPEADQRQRAIPEMASQAALGAAAAPAREISDEAPLSAEDWAARVVALHASGDITGAADTLRAFRVADPDADTYLPESLRNWVQTVE